jgi:hypothetical protein
MSSWQERLKQEFATAQDTATREHVLAGYADQLAALSERERETLFAELTDLGCCTAHGSETHHMRDKGTSNDDGNK